MRRISLLCLFTIDLVTGCHYTPKNIPNFIQIATTTAEARKQIPELSSTVSSTNDAVQKKLNRTLLCTSMANSKTSCNNSNLRNVTHMVDDIGLQHATRLTMLDDLKTAASAVKMPGNYSSVFINTTSAVLQFIDYNEDAHSVEFDAHVGIRATISAESLKHMNRIEREKTNKTNIRIIFVLIQGDVKVFGSHGIVNQVLSVSFAHESKDTPEENIYLEYPSIIARQGKKRESSLKENVTRTQCNRLDKETSRWVPDGCILLQESDPPKCECKIAMASCGMASFTMIVNSKVLPSAVELGIVSIVGCSLSAVGLLATMIIYMYFRELRSRQPAPFLLNICFSLFMANILFLFGIDKANYVDVCYFLTALIHYFLLVSWFWLSANAYNMHQAFVMVHIPDKMAWRISALIAYLIPLVIVCINYGISAHYDLFYYKPDDIFFESSYKARNMCWLRHWSLQLGFLLPVALMFMLNLYILLTLLRHLTCEKRTVVFKGRNSTTLPNLIIALSLLTMTGMAWIFGFLMLISDDIVYRSVMGWIFTICTTSQGWSIFLLNCVRPKSVRQLWTSAIIRFVLRRKPPTNYGRRCYNVSTASSAQSEERFRGLVRVR